jgi:ElaB/YqjD/DUF883 family membrane-anchored ribosome-binding protein
MADRASEWRPSAARSPDERMPDPAAIRAGIRETRERLGDTLEALGERLNPHQLTQDLTQRIKHDIRDATIGRVEHMARHAADRVHETRSSMMDTIRENPIPAAMVGIGLGWLFMNRRRTESHAPNRDAYAAYRQPRVDAYDTGAYGAGAYDSRYAAGPAAGAYGAGHPQRDHPADAPGALDRARDRAQETAHQVADRTQHAAHEVAERTRHAGQAVAHQTRAQVRRVEDRFEEQPLVVGAATLALGLAAGLALPVSDREVQLMGDARDRLVDRVKDVAEETAGKVQHVASRVMDEAQTTARDAARDEGLGSARTPQL